MHPRTLTAQFSICVISENNPHYSSKTSLQEALLEQRSVLVIEDSKLGKKTVLWIRMGRCVDTLSVIAAAGSVLCALDGEKSIAKFAKPLAFTALLAHASYLFVWKPSPLMEYKVAQGPSLWAVIRGHKFPRTVLTKQPSSKAGSYLTRASCIIATVAAFWNDLRSIDFKGFLGKVNVDATE